MNVHLGAATAAPTASTTGAGPAIEANGCWSRPTPET